MLQVACLLLDDPVPNRIHWPRQAELKINSMVYRPYGRNANTKLGANARDEPANAAHRCAAGTNRVQLTCVEDRPFCEYPSCYAHVVCLVPGNVWWAFLLTVSVTEVDLMYSAVGNTRDWQKSCILLLSSSALHRQHCIIMQCEWCQTCTMMYAHHVVYLRACELSCRQHECPQCQLLPKSQRACHPCC